MIKAPHQSGNCGLFFLPRLLLLVFFLRSAFVRLFSIFMLWWSQNHLNNECRSAADRTSIINLAISERIQRFTIFPAASLYTIYRVYSLWNFIIASSCDQIHWNFQIRVPCTISFSGLVLFYLSFCFHPTATGSFFYLLLLYFFFTFFVSIINMHKKQHLPEYSCAKCIRTLW